MTAIIAASPMPRGALRTVARWAPTLLFGLLAFAFLALVSAKFLNDPDTQWHVAAGRWIWANGRVPTVDPFSFTFAGEPWIAKEWLSQLILYAAFAAAGWTGVALLTSAILAGSLATLYAWLGARLRTIHVLAVLTLVFLMAAPQALARPHLLAVPAILVWTAGLVRALDKGRAPHPALLLAMVFWANLHASFPLGLVVAGLLAGEAVLHAPARKRIETMLGWGAFGLGALLAACATPYGVETVRLVVTFANTPEATQYITEWQPLRPDLQGFATGLALALVLAILVPGARRNAFRILVVLLLGYLSLRHQRFTLPFGMIVPFLVAGPAVRRFPSLAPSLQDWPGRWTFRCLGVALAAAVTVPGFVAPEPSAHVTPGAALAYARRAGLQGPVYNEYDFGGTLIFDGIKTFIDGRSDQLFGDGFTTRLYHAIDDAEDAPFAALMHRYDVHWAVVRPGSGEARHLAAMDWTRPYEDEVAAIYVKP